MVEIAIRGSILNEWLDIATKFMSHPAIFSRPFTDFSRSNNVIDINMFTDASGSIGCGGYCDDEWFSQLWDVNFLNTCRPSIEYLELYAVTVAIFNWIHKFQNMHIALFCDNKSVVCMINTTSSSCKNCMVLIRLIVLQGLLFNAKISAKHVSGKLNRISDQMSCNKLELMHRENPNVFRLAPKPIPEHLWPIFKIWVR